MGLRNGRPKIPGLSLSILCQLAPRGRALSLLSAVTVPGPVTPSDNDEIAALHAADTWVAAHAHYEDLLRRDILCNPRDHLLADNKLRRHCARLLITQDARAILTTIWRETGPFSAATLADPRFCRQFAAEPLTSWKLATKLTTSEEVAALNSRIRNIAGAAEAYYLLARDLTRSNRRPLQATELLHAFMLKLSRYNHAAFTEHIRQSSPPSPEARLTQS